MHARHLWQRPSRAGSGLGVAKAPVLRQLLRVAGCLWLLLLAALVGSSARTLVSIHLGNSSLQGADLPRFPSPTPHSRVLVISPHPDDETLGCAGLIQQAVSRGVPITVVFLTNGDAFPASAAAVLHRLKLGPQEFVRVGERRQQEAIAALRTLGVPERDVVFLSYPDRGLLAMWTRYWERPVRARYTHAATSPYPRSFTPDAPYAGKALVADLARLILDRRPTDIFVTHPNDEHTDHQAAGCFTVAAIESLKACGLIAEPGPAVHTYVIHRGDWPVPQGLHPHRKLVPPTSLSALDTRWFSLPLSPAEVRAKAAAVWCYRSQIALPNERRFMASFVRSNELFGEFRWVLGDRPDELAPGDTASGWYTIFDPVGDKVPRSMQPSADIEQVTVHRVGDVLDVRLMLEGRVARWATYVVRIRPVGAVGPSERAVTASLGPRRTSLPKGAICDRAGNVLHMKVPTAAMGNPSEVMVSADTHVGAITVDRTAWRAFRIR